MSLKIRLNYLLENYINGEKKEDSSSDLFQVVIKNIPNEINKITNLFKFKVYGSIGRGNKTSHPWIAILNKEITTSTQRGL